MKIEKNLRILIYSFLPFYDIIKIISKLSQQERNLCKFIKNQTNEQNATSLCFNRKIPTYNEIHYIVEISKSIQLKIQKINLIDNIYSFCNIFQDLQKYNRIDKFKYIMFIDCLLNIKQEDQNENYRMHFEPFNKKQFTKNLIQSIKPFYIKQSKLVVDGSSFSGKLEFFECEIKDIFFISIFKNCTEMVFKWTNTRALNHLFEIFSNLKHLSINQQQLDFLSEKYLSDIDQNLLKNSNRKINIHIKIYGLYMFFEALRTIAKTEYKNLTFTFQLHDYLDLRDFFRGINKVNHQNSVTLKFKRLIYDYNEYDDQNQILSEYIENLKTLSIEKILEQIMQKQNYLKLQQIQSEDQDYPKAIKVQSKSFKTMYLNYKVVTFNSINIEIE